METQNLWPDFDVEPTKSPKTILKEQAGHLMTKTNNVLSADVETSPYQGKIVHRFYIVAPAMNNYRYQLFSVSHSVIYYPLTLEWDDIKSPIISAKKAHNEGEFLDQLSEVFNNPEIIRIISSLLSQSLAE